MRITVKQGGKRDVNDDGMDHVSLHCPDLTDLLCADLSEEVER